MHTALRVIFIYVFILAGMRILGKREFGQLGPMEFISLILIPDLVAQGVVGDDFSMTNAVIAVTTLFAMVFITSAAVHISKRAEVVVEGIPVVLAHNGKLIPEVMNKERVTAEELFAEIHRSGFEELKQVKWAILDSDGKISIIPTDK
jgi:uncharacterized membrane protein YcaP (DUF421 family)